MATRQQLLEVAHRMSQLAQELIQAAGDERDPGETQLTAGQAALLVPAIKSKTPEAMRKWAARHGVVGLRRGRDLYYDRRDVEAKAGRRGRVISHGRSFSRKSA